MKLCSRNRGFIAFVGIVVALATASTAIAQDYPNKAVKLIVPYAAGGGIDLFARPVAQSMTETLGHPVIIDNRAGASGLIGAQAVATAPADGYTLLAEFGSQMLLPFVQKDVPFDNLKDFTPIIAAVRVPNVVVVNASLPIHNMKELVAYAKANPGKFTYVTAGTNTSQHLAGLLLGMKANIDILHVPYKGGGPALNDLIGGQVQGGILVLGTVWAHIQAGKLRAIAVVESTRSKSLPNVPTVGEEVSGYAMPVLWCGLVGPKGLPANVVNRINADAMKAIKNPQIAKVLGDMGYEVTGSTPEQFAQIMKSTAEAYHQITTAAGIKPQ